MGGGPWPDAMHAVRNSTGERRRYVPERTCTAHIGEGDTRGWWVCDSCGDLFDSLSALACKKRKAPNYCPSCGARVVRDGD